LLSPWNLFLIFARRAIFLARSDMLYLSRRNCAWNVRKDKSKKAWKPCGVTGANLPQKTIEKVLELVLIEGKSG